MNNSILMTIKHMLGYNDQPTGFDFDIIVFINGRLMVLEQIGLGRDGFKITGETETWDDFLVDSNRFEAVKTYLYLRTKLVFDPPTNSSLLKAMQDEANELEWRLNVKAE